MTDHEKGRLDVQRDPAALANRVAGWMIAILKNCEHPRVSLSGGSTPRALYELLASDRFTAQVPWRRLSLFWGDERFVAHDHPESNYRMVRIAMLDKVSIPSENVHPVPIMGSPEEAAQQYERILKRAYGGDTLAPGRPLFDIMLLGLGEDGHTASLLPGQPILAERDRWVSAVTRGRPETRISLTYPAINSSRHVAFLVTGQGKSDILRRIHAGERDLPAAHVRPEGELLWFADQAAAGELKDKSIL
jgi:6-phosphogluconolactonase